MWQIDLETNFLEKNLPSRKDLRGSDKIPRMKKTHEESVKIAEKGNAHFLVCPLSESPRGAGYHFYIPGIGRREFLTTTSTLSELNEGNLPWLLKTFASRAVIDMIRSSNLTGILPSSF